MKSAYYMICGNEVGNYELWFNENKELIGGYFDSDAYWRGEYFNRIFKSLGINITSLKYDKKIALSGAKELWNL